MRIVLLLAGAAAIGFMSLPQQAQAQNSGRYTPPPAVQLSPDLTGRWVLQLQRAPEPGRRAAVTLARPRAAMPEYHRSASRAGLGRTPLQADPVRSRHQPRQARRQPSVVSAPALSPERNEIDPKYEPQTVAYRGGHAAGTIVIDTNERFLYLVGQDGTARRYGVGVGKPGFEWAGTHKISRKAEWPDWRPPQQMIEREAEKGRDLPAFVEGGPHNPLGARALYLGSTLYRVHGTNQPWTIGKAVSSGCIRMRNEDVIDLYERVEVGTRVIVI